jgi:hypothetical protein
MVHMHTAATASLVQSSLQAGVSQGLPRTPVVLSLFCQLSHGILPPTVPAPTIGRWSCPRRRASTATLWPCHHPSWRVTTCRHQPAPGVAPGAMKAGGTCCISSSHITSRSTRFTPQALASMATSQVSLSSLCRGTGQHLDVAITAVVATRLTTRAARRTGLCRGHFNCVTLVRAKRHGTEEVQRCCLRSFLPPGHKCGKGNPDRQLICS